MSQPQKDLDANVIHVQFGPGGGRRTQPPPDEKAAEKAEAQPAAEKRTEDPSARPQRRRDPTGDLYARSEVSRLFGIPESRLRYWDRTGFLGPSGQLGARRLYTFQDLIGLRAAKSDH